LDELRPIYKVHGRPMLQCFVGLSHPLVSCSPVRPFANNIHNVVSGLKERVFYIDAVGNKRPGWVAETGDLLSLSEKLGKLVAPSRVSWEHFVSTRPGCKRKLYEAALDRLKN